MHSHLGHICIRGHAHHLRQMGLAEHGKCDALVEENVLLCKQDEHVLAQHLRQESTHVRLLCVGEECNSRVGSQSRQAARSLQQDGY